MWRSGLSLGSNAELCPNRNMPLSVEDWQMSWCRWERKWQRPTTALCSNAPKTLSYKSLARYKGWTELWIGRRDVLKGRIKTRR